MKSREPDPFQVLAAGDKFIRSATFAQALTDRLGSRVAIQELEFEWPDKPFHDVGEVSEAAGDEDMLIEQLAGQQGIVTQLAPLTKRVLDASPELRFIGVSRGGPTNVNLDAAADRGIAVTNVPGRNGVATAEMTLGLILAVTRRIPLTQATLAAGVWRGDFYRADQVGTEIRGTTVGVVGAGAVGFNVASLLAAFGADVLVYDPFVPPGKLEGVGTQVNTLDELFGRSRLVSVHARLTAQTRGLVSRERLLKMPAGSYIVNSARGGLVDYDAVADCLASGHLSGAAFDVFPTEPADFSHPLFSLLKSGHNIVVTPHVAGASTQTALRAASGVALELERFIDGAAPLHPLVAAATPVLS